MKQPNIHIRVRLCEKILVTHITIYKSRIIREDYE